MIELKNTRGHSFFVDQEDVERVSRHKWYRSGKTENSYFYTKVNVHTTLLLHVFLMGKKENLVIDHIDNRKNNNCKSNLRFIPFNSNLNRQIKKKPLSGYFGVSDNHGKWSARIRDNYRTICSPNFENKIYAAVWYDVMSKKLHGKHAKVNFESFWNTIES